MASRDLTAGLLAEITAGKLRPVVFYEGEFASSQFLRLWSGVGPISWNGETWTGGGSLLAIAPLEEVSRVEAVGFTVTLSGMPSSLIAIALDATVLKQGAPGKVWLGCLDAAGAVIADPYLSAQGRFDVTVTEDDGAHCTISAQYESSLIDLFRPRERHYAHEDQQIDFSGDRGFEYVPQLQDMELIWGGPQAASAPLAQPAAPSGDSGYQGGLENGPRTQRDTD